MIAAAMCGTMPSVHPNAATTLARDPRERPAASVNRTPVPGETMMISEVTRKSIVTDGPPPLPTCSRTRRQRRGAGRRAPVTGGLLVAVHDLDQPRLTESAAQDLQPDRQAVADEAHGHGDRRKTGRRREPRAVVPVRRVEVADRPRWERPRRKDQRVEPIVVHHLLHRLPHALHVFRHLRAPRILIQRRLGLTVDQTLLD